MNFAPLMLSLSEMRFIKESHIKASPERVFAFHELPDAFERLIPPWENAKIIQKADISKIGSQAIIEQKILWIFPSRWVAEHVAYDPPHSFEDVQKSGPFKSWRHKHIIEPDGNGEAILRDEIDYEMPIPAFGPLAAPIAVEPQIRRMFEYRHQVTKDWCEDRTNQ